ncbi:putative uncharacterized transmembrane protein DDB_G0290641 isoform X2 [Daktulosphaira vitifoliae]|uniref:putative uncharacterized transmembrane protein DDB_G0290641 isoform X2 n=1 Tax=Daktulosphaira vitifoliae TaxID=58002 RepID=UPI0021A9FB57|nr:putative uncharacterized transmembrane protein DDB_G0290641 isoform X2 [Daktulosphaira vitifoliae]
MGFGYVIWFQDRYKDLDSEYFIKCIVKLKETIRKSTKMFIKFVYVVIFLYDVNDYLYKQYNLEFKSIVNHIEMLYGLTLKYYPNIQNKSNANRVLKNVVRFLQNTLEQKTLVELDQINDSAVYYTKNSVNATLVVEHGVDLNNVIVAVTIKKHTRLLNWFYKIAVKDGYYDLGFDKVIVGNTYRHIKLEIKGRHRDYKPEHENDDFNEAAEDAEVDEEEEEDEKLQQQRIQQQQERYRKQQREREQHQQQKQQYNYSYEVYNVEDYIYGDEED